jgi:hypothetical protein
MTTLADLAVRYRVALATASTALNPADRSS